MPSNTRYDSRAAASAALRAVTATSMDSTIRAGAILYDRRRDLRRLLRIDDESALADTEPAAAAIVAKLENALRGERARARAGHWTYDLNRHIALHQAHHAESARLVALRGPRPR